MPRYAAALAWLALAAAHAHPEGFSFPREHRGDMTAELSVHVADRGITPGLAVVTLRVTVEGGSGLAVEKEEVRLEDAIEAWKPEFSPPRRVEKDGRVVWSRSVVLRQVKPGSASLPSVRVRFRDSPGAAWQQAEWVDVLKEIHDRVTPAGPLPEPPAWRRWLPAAAVGCGVLVVVLAAVAWRRRRAPALPPLSPVQRALGELTRLDGTAEVADADAFYTDLSGVVRHYLEERYGLHAPRQTTAEFLAAVGQVPEMPETQQGPLRELLERCDLAKFARASSTPGDRREAIARARAFVEETATSPAPPG